MPMPSKSIQQWLDAAGRVKSDDKNDTIKLCQDLTKMKPGSKPYLRTVNKVCEMNLLLVVSVVKGFVRKRASLSWTDGNIEDLLQQGYFGLRRAAEKFDPTKGFSFSTYANPWIRQSVTRYYNATSNCCYIPENVSQQLFYIAKHGKKKEGSRAVSTSDKLISAGWYAMHPVALDAPAFTADEEGGAYHETVAYKAPEPSFCKGEPNWATEALDRKIEEAGLSELEAKLIREYGRRGRRSISAQACGLTETAARPIFNTAIEKLSQLTW